MFILGSPKEMFTKGEFEAMRSYLESGGGILVLSSDGGELKYLFFLFSRGKIHF